MLMYIAIPVWVKYKKGQTRRFAPTNNVLIAIGKRYNDEYQRVGTRKKSKAKALDSKQLWRLLTFHI